jgi:hypothetical protein
VVAGEEEVEPDLVAHDDQVLVRPQAGLLEAEAGVEGRRFRQVPRWQDRRDRH